MLEGGRGGAARRWRARAIAAFLRSRSRLAHACTRCLRPGDRRHRRRRGRPHCLSTPPAMARAQDLGAGRLGVDPREGRAGLSANDSHQRGLERAPRREDRAGTGPRRGNSTRQTGPPRPPVLGVPPRHPRQLAEHAPRRRQGRTSARQVQPLLCRHLLEISRPAPSTSASTAPAAGWRTPSASTSSNCSRTGPLPRSLPAN